MFLRKAQKMKKIRLIASTHCKMDTVNLFQPEGKSDHWINSVKERGRSGSPVENIQMEE
jgi:hypothetical protein